MKCTTVALAALLAWAATLGAISPPPLVLQHVAVIPGDGSPTMRDATVLIRAVVLHKWIRPAR